MVSVTYDGQSFSIDGRRSWILGASIEYARVPPEFWADRIAAAKQAGFNTIATSCPWMVHEPRKGRFTFHGEYDIRRPSVKPRLTHLPGRIAYGARPTYGASDPRVAPGTHLWRTCAGLFHVKQIDHPFTRMNGWML